MRMNKFARRVVITGMGIVSPYGVGLDLFWDSLIQEKAVLST